MPLYEYGCKSCNTQTNLRHSYKDTVSECPACKVSGSISKIYGTTNFIKKLPPRSNQPAVVGSATNKAITDAKRDLSQQKKELKKRKK